jgi:hypothetical protein
MYGNANKGVDDNFSVQNIPLIFQRLCSRWDLPNQLSFINSYTKSSRTSNTFGLDMITLPSHTSHALQPLDVSYFTPFKIALKKERDVAMAKNKYQEPNKNYNCWLGG